MIKLIQPVVLVLSVMCLIGAVSVHAEEYENADYTGLPVAELTNVYLPLADTVRAEFSSVEVSEAEPACKLIEDHYDYTGTVVVGCRSGGASQKTEWSYLY